MDEWFSAMLSFVVAVEGEPEVMRSRSVILLRGPEFDFARVHEIAIATGRAMETSYGNEYGRLVTWALEKVETIDRLGPHLDEEREVYHEFTADFPRSDLAYPLNPEAFDPRPSGA